MDINEAWKSVCRVLFHKEIGDLNEYNRYLMRYVGPVRSERKSFISEKEVTTGDDDFGLNIKYISNSEREDYFKRCSKPFEIDEIKDIDSIFSAIGERFIYSGDIVLGNFNDVHKVNRCANVTCVHNSQDISDSKYIAHCAMLRKSSFVFGSDCTGEIDYVIKNFQGWRSRRMMETSNTQYVSDAYFCANIRQCQEIMFSFNQNSKQFMIGNNTLNRDKYLSLKEKLLAEIADELTTKKEIISLAELLGAPSRTREIETRPKTWNVQNYFGKHGSYPCELDKAFAETMKIIFGREINGKLTDYENWLMKYVRAPPKSKSAISGKSILVLPILFNEPVRNTHITQEETQEAGEKKISIEAVEKLSVSNAKELLRSIVYFSCDVALGNNLDISETVSFSDSNAVFASSTMYGSKRCAYDCWVSHDAENMFGCDHTFYSKFCINTYRSLRMQRCFETSDSLDCSDCYFCHNCEGLSNCMFCFNAKALKYAIGNVELPQKKYFEIKKKILSGLSEKIEKDRGLELSIYNLGIIQSLNHEHEYKSKNHC